MILALRIGASYAARCLFRNRRRFPSFFKFLILHGAGLTLAAQMPYYAALGAILLMTLGFIILQLHKETAKSSAVSCSGKKPHIFAKKCHKNRSASHECGIKNGGDE